MAAPNGDLGVIGIVLFWMDFTDDERVADFLTLVHWDVIVVDEKKCVSPGDSLGIWRGSCPNTLAETA